MEEGGGGSRGESSALPIILRAFFVLLVSIGVVKIRILSALKIHACTVNKL